jgi:S-methylmethionine-dependent homocysteine/selenocysteine methylase
MTGYRERLPQLGHEFFLTDGGIETTLSFLEGLELPDFAAFALLKRPDGEAVLRRYFRGYAALARRFVTGLILESPSTSSSRTPRSSTSAIRSSSARSTRGSSVGGRT